MVQKNKARKTLERDSRGRWMKRSSASKHTSTKTKKTKRKKKDNDDSKNSTQNEATKVLNDVEEEFNKHCPRCAGEMNQHWIRCGPEKTIQVKKCMICNFWLPISN